MAIRAHHRPQHNANPRSHTPLHLPPVRRDRPPSAWQAPAGARTSSTANSRTSGAPGVESSAVTDQTHRAESEHGRAPAQSGTRHRPPASERPAPREHAGCGGQHPIPDCRPGSSSAAHRRHPTRPERPRRASARSRTPAPAPVRRDRAPSGPQATDEPRARLHHRTIQRASTRRQGRPINPGTESEHGRAPAQSCAWLCAPAGRDQGRAWPWRTHRAGPAPAERGRTPAYNVRSSTAGCSTQSAT